MRKTLTLALIAAVAVLTAPQPAIGAKATNMASPAVAAKAHCKLLVTTAQPHCHSQKTAATHKCNHNKPANGHQAVETAKLHCKKQGQSKLSDGPVIPPDPTDCPAYCGYACGCKDCDS